MLSFIRKKAVATSHHATINGKAIQVNPGETVLQAAEREHIDFPHSCRVGGCAACKCQLTSGKVKSLTDSSYVLSDEELDAGYILACQAVPQTDLEIRVNVQQASTQRVDGRIKSQTKLTHDITLLTVQLADGLSYRAGQYADLELAALPNIKRSYSFATAPCPSGRVSFFVKHVPNGQFSSAINTQNLIDQTIWITGPIGEFYLKPSDYPLLLIAGGSGLAPIMAILERALADNIQNPVTLLFGARTQQDLYLLERIQDIQSQWPSAFQFVPVLSNEPADSSWQGARGWVTDHLPKNHLPKVDAYLCGPPAMIDSTEDQLTTLGVPPNRIHCDRFLTVADTIPA
jgi:3-phenylpropionate/trans-cinnamate dioxygenase ferredoxin reductase subunit